MLIATREYSVEMLLQVYEDQDKLDEYVLSLIPEKFKHVSAILSNQKYFINYKILNDKDIPMDQKTLLSNALVARVHVVGYLDEFTTMDEIRRYVNMDRVAEYHRIEEGQNGKG